MGHFNIRPSGEIYVNRQLDREQNTQYTLDIVASDGAYVTRAQAVINILDANDNTPECAQVNIHIYIHADMCHI